MRAPGRLVTAGSIFWVSLAGVSAPAQAAPDSPPPERRTAWPPLEVPYLAQSEQLCGGAAVAMVERWWGRRGVYAEDFAPLVSVERGGILTTDLAQAARNRGWAVTAFDGTAVLVRRHLAQGEPVVALIEVGPSRYHYVVVLGWDDGQVVFHDPARSPWSRMSAARFEKAWGSADRWAMVLRPAGPRESVAVAPTPVSTSSPGIGTGPMRCPPWLDRAVDAALDNRLEEAANLLAQARASCPEEAIVLRELAGVRFKQGRHAEAISLSAAYLTHAPDDSLGWQLLAAATYVNGDPLAALDAWNRIGRPRVDLIRIDGVRHIRFREIAGALAIHPGSVLTRSLLSEARRRVEDVPALRRATVDYQPVEGGLVEIRAAVAERPVVVRITDLLVSGAARAVAQNEVQVEIASPTGAGELWTATGRWERARPRVALRLDVPARLGVRGVIGVEGAWERFRFAPDTAFEGAVQEERRFGELTFGGWLAPALRPSGGVRVERWSGDRDYLAGIAETELRAARNRFALRVSGEYALTLTSSSSYAKGAAGASWTSSSGIGRTAWSARVGLDLTSRSAPLGTRPIAGGNPAWAIPLRAHSASDEGGLLGRAVGRAIAHGGVSVDHPVRRVGPVTIALGVFADAARVFSPLDRTGPDRYYLDAGGGIRLGIANGDLGVLRIDLAHGLTDRSSAVTFGVHRSWPTLRESPR